LRKGARLAPHYGPVWEHLGLAYARQGHHREAAKSFERATKAMPNYKLAWQHLAVEYQALGQPAESQAATARAAQLKSAAPSPAHKKHKAG
jgi:Tfp pilus assembly protein PilF